MRSHIVYGVAVGLLGLGLAACASSGSSTPSLTMEAGSGQVGPAFLEWTGRFRAVQQQTGNAMAPRARNQASGTVRLTAPQLNQTHVELTVSGPVQDAVRLPWAIAPGACRSGTIPLLAVSQFPEITMNNGRGELDEVISLQMPTSGTYHVNVYDGTTQDESGVMTCAELTLGRRSGSD